MDSNPLLEFVKAITHLANQNLGDEALVIEQAKPLMRQLISRDDWLPEAMTASHPDYYQQHLLYGDPLDRFSLVSFVWGPGQKTPIHDHMVWGIIGMLRGLEFGQRYERAADGSLSAHGPEELLRPGDIDVVSPDLGDIHLVRNGLDDQVSISIHLYGGNIGRIQRHVFAPGTGESKAFVSGYSNTLSPNLWAKAAA